MEIANTPDMTPVSQQDRLVILDSLRGIALFGILLMNILWFGHFGSPDLLNETGTINEKIAFFIEVVPEGTQRAIFSMLFGCGVIVFITRAESRLPGISPVQTFVRRQMWLLLFGLFNVFILLWPGDILYQYALAGLVLIPFIRVKPTALFVAATICMLLVTARENRDLYKHKNMVAEGERIEAIDTTQVKLTEKQKEKLGAMTEFRTGQKAENRLKRLEKQKEAILGSYEDIYTLRSGVGVQMETKKTYYYFFFDALVFMFIGMAFFRLGILQGEAPMKTYAILALSGLLIGISLTYLRVKPVYDLGFDGFAYTKQTNLHYYEISRTFKSIGLFGLIMVCWKTGWFNRLFVMMQPVGQMAFTNYLMQSLICGIIFYGIGFGLANSLQRYEVYGVVGIIWIFQLIFSHVWLRYFRFGPMEWIWRSLTYWKKQPFVKRKESLVVV